MNRQAFTITVPRFSSPQLRLPPSKVKPEMSLNDKGDAGLAVRFVDRWKNRLQKADAEIPSRPPVIASRIDVAPNLSKAVSDVVPFRYIVS